MNTYKSYVSISSPQWLAPSETLEPATERNHAGAEERATSSHKRGVYPNPANEFINIHDASDNPAQGKIIIYDSFGRTVLKLESITTTASIDVSGFGTGLYLIQLSIKGQIWKENFIIQH